MFKQKLSRREFLKGMGVGIAVLNLPGFPNTAEAAGMRSGQDFYIVKID